MKEEMVSYSYARSNLKSMMDMVCDNHESVLVARKSGGNVVMLSEEDYDSLMETMYLLSTEKNRKRLNSALKGGDSTTFKNLKELKDAYKI
jgi:antitoxin YefM